jgi:hypothetical protein
MVLRAKVKALKDMPQGVLCCEKMKEQLVAFGNRTINVTTAKLKKSHCPFCKAPFMGMRMQGLRGWRIDPRAWEIEEAPLEEAK